MGDWLKLLVLNLKVKFKNVLEYLHVIQRYYRNAEFRSADLSLLRRYLFHNPFKISRKFLQSQGFEEIHAYGETPLTTMEEIAKVCEIASSDVVFEMGCGRGRCCFWLASFVGCRVVGIDFVPYYIEIAQWVVEKYRLERKLNFILQDIRQADLTSATVIYLYGTCYEDEFILALVRKFRSVPPGTKIISISYSIAEYAEEGEFEVVKKFPVALTWGIADGYLQVKI